MPRGNARRAGGAAEPSGVQPRVPSRRVRGVVRRSVLTLRFDRFTPLPARCCTLRKARRARALVVTTPTALKSIAQLGLRRADPRPIPVAQLEGAAVENPHAAALRRLFEGATERRSRSWQSPTPADSARVRFSNSERRRRRRGDCQALQTSGTLVLDEVDLILHPLRSELHWPLGRRVPLDFSKSRAGDGLRWKLPSSSSTPSSAWVFVAPPRRRRRVPTRRLRFSNASPRASTPPSRPRVQSQPHVVLLDKAWYKAELTPLLAEWAELWLRAHGAARGVAEHHMRAYLTRTEGAAEAAQVIEREAEDESLKMINLARDWLTALLPHVLAKINRVSYGLLSAKDVQALEHATEAPGCPPADACSRFPSSGRTSPRRRTSSATRTSSSGSPSARTGTKVCAGAISDKCCALCSPNSSRRRDRRANENRRGDGRSSCDAPADARRGARGSRRRRETHGRVAQGGHHGRGLARAVALAEDDLPLGALRRRRGVAAAACRPARRRPGGGALSALASHGGD